MTKKQLTQLELRALKPSDLEAIVFGILIAFDGYFVTMPTEISYWEQRFKRARLCHEASFGYFEGENLVAFILHGVDHYKGAHTAFNIGTGVAPKFRGHQLVDRLYEAALPVLKRLQVQQIGLDVIQENARAIRVYERLGFQKARSYHCFAANLQRPETSNITLQALPTPFKAPSTAPFPEPWDNTDEGMAKVDPAQLKAYTVWETPLLIGYFAIHPETGYLYRLQVKRVETTKAWLQLFEGIAQVASKVRLYNIDSRYTALLNVAEQLNFKATVKQFELFRPC